MCINSNKIKLKKTAIIIQIMIILIIIVAFIVYSASVDYAEYSSDGKKVTIKKGTGEEILSVDKLINTNHCFSECWTIWNVTIFDGNYKFLDSIKFKDKEGKDITIQFKVEYWNNSWIPFDTSKKLDIGNYTLKLTGYKKPTESIDWIPTFAGKDSKDGIAITSWDWWYGAQPTGYWKLNESSGDATDYGSGGHNAIDQGTTVYGASKLGNGVIYTGDVVLNGDDYLDIGDYNDFGANGFTLLVWVNASNVFGGNIKPILSKSTNYDPSNSEWNLRWNTDGTIRFAIKDNTGAQFTITSASSYADSDWHRVVIIRDDSLGIDNIVMYVDNATAGSAGSLGGANLNTPANFQIGHQVALTPFTTHRSGIDDVQLYIGENFTQADISEDWNGGVGIEGDTSFTGISSVSLLIPKNYGNLTYLSNYLFQSSATLLSANYTNSTLFIWYTNGSLFNSTVNNSFIGIPGNLSHVININMVGNLGKFNWNTLLCSNSTVGGNQCKFASSNYTFIINETVVPNVTIVHPNNTYTGITYIPLNFTAVDNYYLSYCYYNVTRGASLEIANTQITNCQNTTFTVSGDANYVINLCANDTTSNINCTSASFTTSNYVAPPTPGSPGGGGGGSVTIEKIIETLKEKLPTKICDKGLLPLKDAWKDFKDKKSWDTFKTLWYSYWDYTLCKNAASFIPVE